MHKERKGTVYYLYVNIWVRALGLCLLLLQSAYPDNILSI